jgi:hypothetical protein
MRHALLFALALCAAPLSALAQEAPIPLERDDDLTPPELPEVPEALRASVDALRATVQGTEECYSGEGRMEHTPDARCPQWYARLGRGGAAAVFAIGEVLRPVRENPNDPPMEPLRSTAAEYDRGPRLVQLLARTGRPEAVPFLISYVVRTATRPDFYPTGTDAVMLRALRSLTGDDPVPTAPWEDDASHLEGTLSRRELAQRWVRWYREHQGMTVAQWRAEGAARALRELSSEDILARYSAIARLAPNPAHRVAVTASLRELLAREDLPAAARVHLHRLARQRRIPLVTRTLLASAQ